MSDAPTDDTETAEGAETVEGEALLGTAYPEDDTAETDEDADLEAVEAPEDEDETEGAEPAETSSDTPEPQAEASPRGLLMRGHRGPDVAALQAALAAAGHECPQDGIFDHATGRAVKAYQAAQGYASTGTVGPTTALALGL
jgi:peptidoglycan hydrolase-like protein with peptidoglycan-binding domain